MKTVVLDFESFYSGDVGFSKQTNMGYITDPNWETIMVGVQWAAGHEPFYVCGDAVHDVMDTIRKDQDNTVVVAHNAVFDASIMSWHYNVRPAFIADTLSMARSLGLQAVVGGSLAKLAEQMRAAGINVPPKGNEVVNALGKRLADFTPQQLKDYGHYCMDDVRITRVLYDHLLQHMSVDEMVWQSKVLKMYTEPALCLNQDVIIAEAMRVAEKREATKQRLAHALGVKDMTMLMSVLNSNPKFAEALQLFGAEAPKKISKDTGRETLALGIKDAEFLAMLDHPIPEVRELVVARMGLKSSIEETRCRQFDWLAQYPFLPVPYKVSGARTHRLGGGEGDADGSSSSGKMGVWNAQNLPSGRIKGQSKQLRVAIEAPDGHVLVGADSSQVEVRTIDYIANNTPSLVNFANGVCPYSSVAVQLFNEGEPEQIKRDAKKGIEPWAMRRQIAKSARLALQFGQGAAGYKDYAKTQAGLDLTLEEAELYKTAFRRSNPAITSMWRTGDKVLAHMVEGGQGYFGGPDGKLFFYDGSRMVLGQHIPGVRLPDGCWVSYPQLQTTNGMYGVSYLFIEMNGRKKDFIYLHGSKFIQQLTQATAFAVMKWYATQFDYKLVLNSHDEHVLCVPADQAEQAAKDLETLMKQAPPWAPGLPLDCEVHVGTNYGDLK